MSSVSSVSSVSTILSSLYEKVGELCRAISSGEEICKSDYAVMVDLIVDLKKMYPSKDGLKKRGRPRKDVADSCSGKLLEKGKRGRPRKERKTLEINGGGEDIFAALIMDADKNVNAEEAVKPAEEAVNIKPPDTLISSSVMGSTNAPRDGDGSCGSGLTRATVRNRPSKP